MVQGDAADGESWWNPDGPASLIGKLSYDGFSFLFSDEGLSCLGGKLFLTKTLDELVQGDQQAPAFQQSKQVTFVVLWRLAYNCVITTDFVKEHWLPTVLIFVHSDVQVQPSKLPEDHNHMHMDT
jgi:hypothetical protein